MVKYSQSVRTQNTTCAEGEYTSKHIQEWILDTTTLVFYPASRQFLEWSAHASQLNTSDKSR